jgi:hypothetical protein
VSLIAGFLALVVARLLPAYMPLRTAFPVSRPTDAGTIPPYAVGERNQRSGSGSMWALDLAVGVLIGGALTALAAVVALHDSGRSTR